MSPSGRRRVVVRCSRAWYVVLTWCVLSSSTSSDTVRELVLVRAAHLILIPNPGLGLGWVSPRQPNLSFWENFQKKKRFFHRNRHSTTTVKPMVAAIWNPQHHRYLVAFYQKSAIPYRHGATITAIWQHYSGHIIKLTNDIGTFGFEISSLN